MAFTHRDRLKCATSKRASLRVGLYLRNQAIKLIWRCPLETAIILKPKLRGKRSKETALAFSVTCSSCNRRFVDIDESLIGQQARCRCGSIVELDPVWDFDKSNTSRRPKSKSRKTSSARPAKAAKSSKRGSAPKTAKSQPSAKTPAVTNRSSARIQKQEPKQPQPADTGAASIASPPSENDAVESKAKAKAEQGAGTVFDSYADLDQILAAGVDHTPLESTRVDSPFEPTEEEAATPRRRGLVGAGIGGLTGLLAAFILLVTRVSAFGGTPMGWSGHAFYGTYTASYGSGEMTNTCTNLFIGIGWWILLLAVLMGIASGLLLARVVIQVTANRNPLAWSRGLLATLSVVCLFTLMGLLFVQTIHHGNLIRDLDSFSNSAPFEGLLEPVGEVETFRDIREKHEAENTDFMIGVLTFAVIPLISFGGVAVSLLFDEG